LGPLAAISAIGTLATGAGALISATRKPKMPSLPDFNSLVAQNQTTPTAIAKPDLNAEAEAEKKRRIADGTYNPGGFSLLSTSAQGDLSKATTRRAKLLGY